MYSGVFWRCRTCSGVVGLVAASSAFWVPLVMKVCPRAPSSSDRPRDSPLTTMRPLRGAAADGRNRRGCGFVSKPSISLHLVYLSLDSSKKNGGMGVRTPDLSQ